MHILMVIGSLMFAFGCSSNQEAAGNNETFLAAENEWRRVRDQEMRGPESWLNIAGLYWLEPGENTFGTGAENKITLPEGSAPENAGSIWLEDKTIRVTSDDRSVIRHHGEVVTDMVLNTDKPGPPDILELKDLRCWIIERSGRYAFRLRDLKTKAFTDYTGLEYFPPQSKYQIKAKFTPFHESRTVSLLTMVGMEADFISPGYLTFTLEGIELRLDALYKTQGAEKLFLIFADDTSGEETYGGGRFLDAYFLDEQIVDLNFNRATNPPCAYTKHATCPLPPEQNVLPLRIEAGEKNYPGHI